MPFGNAVGEGFVNSGIVVATKVIIQGANGELLVYSGTPAAGNLTESIAAVDFVDSLGNHGLSGVVTYGGTGIATQLDQGAISMYVGSLAAGWTFKSQVFIGPLGDIELIQALGRGVLTSNNTLDNGSGGATFNGNVVISGTLSVNGSPNTSTNGLTDGTVHGTSGAASAGTAHTHSPGSFAVGNGTHNHTL